MHARSFVCSLRAIWVMHLRTALEIKCSASNGTTPRFFFVAKAEKRAVILGAAAQPERQAIGGLDLDREKEMAWRGHLSRNLKELRFLYCQTSPASSHTREFVRRNYPDLKTLNPKLPILIRECTGVEPQLWARYDMGVERCVRLDGLTEAQITKKLEELVKAGEVLKG